jgi:hypothetical protein
MISDFRRLIYDFLPPTPVAEFIEASKVVPEALEGGP